MRVVFICHADDALGLEGLARWLASFSDLAGIVVLQETHQRMWKRIRREIRRVGGLRFLDVLTFRLYYRLFLAARDADWETQRLDQVRATYGPVPSTCQVLHTHSPNSPEAEQFIRGLSPDLMIARCKTLLKESVLSLPTHGTHVMHPGICPEYRNAHGCFWALANDDLANVGMTLLRIDKGVDTGPVYGYFRAAYDERTQSHIVIQHRMVFDQLSAIQAKLRDIHAGRATPLNTSGRRSAEWGQPWLSAYLAWKSRAARRKGSHAHLPAVS